MSLPQHYFLRRILSKIIPGYVAPYSPPVVPIPPSGEIPPPPYPLVDASGWIQETPGWVFDGTEIRYEGVGHSTLRSPRRPLPEDRRVKLSATMDCDTYGPYKAKMSIGYNSYAANGTGTGGKGTAAESTGMHTLDEEPYPTAVEYEIMVVAYTQFQGGTNDTAPLIPRLHNLCAGDET